MDDEVAIVEKVSVLPSARRFASRPTWIAFGGSSGVEGVLRLGQPVSVYEDEIGERTAGVDANPISHVRRLR